MDINVKHIQAALCGSSFRLFVETFWQCVSSDKFKGGLVVDVLCEHLQAVKDGVVKRLAVAMPVRHGKSLITSVMFPVWLWVHDPTLRILTVSNGERLALRDALRSRQLSESSQFQELFGNLFKLVDEQNAKSYYTNSQKGSRVSLGVGSNTNGQDADVIIADDLLDYDKAKFELERQNAIDYWEGTLTQRLAHGNDKDRILLVGHRVHEEDVFNHVFETYGNEGEWSYLVLPAEARPDVTNSYNNATGWVDTREEGELLCPDRFSREVLESKKKGLRHKYSCIYQQDPAPQSGDLFKPDWFRHYTKDNDFYYFGDRKVRREGWRFATVDTAITTNRNSDYTVCQVWDVVGQDLVLVHQLRKRLDGNQIVPAITEVVNVYRPQFVVVEREFIGQFVIDQLRAANVPVKPFRSKSHGDKEARAIAAEIRLEAGRVWFPANADWVADLQREILGFPNSVHDDQVDCLSMACITADKYHGRLEREQTEEEKVAELKRKREEHFNRLLNADGRIWTRKH